MSDTQSELISLGDLGKAIQEELQTRVSAAAVGLVSMTDSGSGFDGDLLGSGTLIEIDERYFVLTADHVLTSSQFRNSTHLGLTVSPDGGSFKILKNALSQFHVGKPTRAGQGPDLALLELPQETVGWLIARKEFIRVSADQSSTIMNGMERQEGVFALFGCPAENSEKLEFSETRRREVHIHAMLAICIPESMREEDDFDYFTIEVPHRSVAKMPSTFKGVSGGGLWYVQTSLKPDGKISCDFVLLAGVAYSEDIDNEKTTLNCHGPKSIYQNVVNAIRVPSK